MQAISDRNGMFCFSGQWSVVLRVALLVLGATTAWAGELTVEDFALDGPSGSQGASIERIGPNHFRVARPADPGRAPRGRGG